MLRSVVEARRASLVSEHGSGGESGGEHGSDGERSGRRLEPIGFDR